MQRTRHVIGIGGASGSGKSTLAAALVSALGEAGLSLAHDDYYRPLTPGERANLHLHDFDDPRALDSALLVSHLEALRRGEAIEVPEYAFAAHDRRGARTVAPREVVVVEGVLLLAVPELRAAVDVCVFVDTPLALCLERRLERDVRERGRTPESVRAQWAATVAPAWSRHVAPSRAHAHRVADGTLDLGPVVADLLAGLPTPPARAPRRRSR